MLNLLMIALALNLVLASCSKKKKAGVIGPEDQIVIAQDDPSVIEQPEDLVPSGGNDGVVGGSIGDTEVPDVSGPSPIALTSASQFASSSFTISGTCGEGDRIILGGQISASDVSPSSLEATCTSSGFSFAVVKNDGIYNLSLYAEHNSQQTETVQFSLLVDTVAPTNLQLMVPNSTPVLSGDSSLTVEVSCETGATVSITKDLSDSGTCLDSVYSFTFDSGNVTGTYSFDMMQTDIAGNTSGLVTLTWTYSLDVPSTPTIEQGSEVYDNTVGIPENFVVSGTCIDGYSLNIQGAGTPSPSLPYTCASSSYSISFSYVEVDANSTHVYSVKQTNPISGQVSAGASVSYIHDDQNPSDINIVTPAASMYTGGGPLLIVGTCEDQAIVSLSGDETSSVSCIAGSFTLSFDEDVDGTYNYSLVQVDRAGNVSASAQSLTWIRDTSVPAVPSVTSPSSSVYLSNEDILFIAGTCSQGNTVILYDSEIQIDSYVCTDNSEFVFSLDRSGDSEDAAYNLGISQVDGIVESLKYVFSWNRDVTSPDAIIEAGPPAINLASEVQFLFSSGDSEASFECRYDDGIWHICSSPYLLTNLTNGEHTFYLRSVDPAGNQSEVSSYSFTQDAMKTIGLWHFDMGAETIDESSNGLNFSVGSANSTAGVFYEAAEFSTGQYQNPDDDIHDLTSSVMTIDFWVDPPAIDGVGNNDELVLISKDAANQMVYSLRLKKQGGSSNWRLLFYGSGDLTSYSSVSSGGFSDFAGFAHIAVVWNRGDVRFYLNGGLIHSGLIGVSGSTTLATGSTASLKVATDGFTSGPNNGDDFTGVIDELRISQVERYFGSFNPEAVAYGEVD